MGLVSGVILLPLAPVRGVMWIAEQIQQEAARRTDDPAALRRRLAEVDRARENGELSAEEAASEEEELVRRLLASGPPLGGLEV
ncbi:c-type cytochrome biogenesis protein CcmI [Actinacidiphila acidipaludis]|uniref:C-type cytochrome biogenesis protein CcmI n=1 Tax=Actinacidiphila acidipaludis TaxID=2873382 RepID=A0ABS7QII6_9ACTN|nr:c-type cytochrome biogenesis protein CcmI [Streptomyces acidipaludis]MBY8882225.1 c-type cytochrome biogenesis protein CcmI [Streptomyces acidipaludis]